MRYPHACDAASFAARTTRNRVAGASWRDRTSWVIGSRWLSSTRSKAACTSAMIGPMAARIDRAGQRHVKAKVLEHERVIPAVEVFDLASARARRNAPVPLL